MKAFVWQTSREIAEAFGKGRWRYSVQDGRGWGMLHSGDRPTWRQAYDAACAELRKRAES